MECNLVWLYTPIAGDSDLLESYFKPRHLLSHSFTGITGWLSSARSKPQPPTAEKEEAVPKGHATQMTSSFEDESRVAMSVAVSPR